ncbi:MAG: cell wall hydrolase [Pseudomonadota bacterium]
MSTKLQIASAVAVTASTLTVLMAGDVGLAYDKMVNSAQMEVVSEGATETQTVDQQIVDQTANEDQLVESTSEESAPLMVQPLPADYKSPEEKRAEIETGKINANSLRELVQMQDRNADLDDQMRCLAGAVYFESKGESLRGQLAVARVVMARAESSRFPNSYCGVVYQRSQFSFVRGGKMPRINTGSQSWANAKAIAQIAHQNAWESDVEGALFFHARYVNPRWRLKRIAQIDNHVFYR